jgi:hypothetical protein
MVERKKEMHFIAAPFESNKNLVAGKTSIIMPVRAIAQRIL